MYGISIEAQETQKTTTRVHSHTRGLNDKYQMIVTKTTNIPHAREYIYIYISHLTAYHWQCGKLHLRTKTQI